MEYSPLSDIELASLLQSGDHTAYKYIYQRYYRVLFVHAYKRLRDQEQSKDIIQEVFTKLWDKREAFVLASSLAGFLFTAVNNKIVDYFLHKEVQAKYFAAFGEFLDVETQKTDYLVRENQLMALIEQEIQQLPPKMREVFELSRKSNLSHKEIADRLAISEKTVDRQISNALFRLKTKLGLIVFIVFLTKF